jgi:hypothetical protein
MMKNLELLLLNERSFSTRYVHEESGIIGGAFGDPPSK